jgi:hypothetical protein
MTAVMVNKKRFDLLRGLSPTEAVKAWLEGDFGMGDEAALIEAIRKDKRITRSDDEIIDLMVEMMEESLDGQAVLDRLAGSEEK